MARRGSSGWRALLKEHREAFVTWLEENEVFARNLENLAAGLENLLTQRLDAPEARALFAEAIPDVFRACNDLNFDAPLRTEAYAFSHLLERYRRTWIALLTLMERDALPLARYGVRLLDVGTGPAPVAYAVDDFYRALIAYAAASDVASLQLPPPVFEAVEGSDCMARLVHHLSELTGRAGPFGVTFREFATFDPVSIRRRSIEGRIATVAEEDDIGLSAAADWVHRNEGHIQGLHTYRLCVFSNFLTTTEMLDDLEARVAAAMTAVTPGGVVLLLGGLDDDYQQIYERVAELAHASGLTRVEGDSRLRIADDAHAADRIKQVYARIWSLLDDVGVVPVEATPRKLWDPAVRPKLAKTVGFHAFRRAGTDG